MNAISSRPMAACPTGVTPVKDWAWDLIAVRLFLIVAFCIAMTVLSFSLHWRMEHDTPLLHYVAWMMDTHGAVPYRDIFETSFPGTFLFHWLIGHNLGWGDQAFHEVDACLLVLLALMTVRMLRPLGYATALGAALLFMISYLKYGPSTTLQKDYVGLIFVVMATTLAVDEIRLYRWLRAELVGFLFGLAVTVKPHLAIGLLPVGAFLTWREYTARQAQPESLYRLAFQTIAMLAIGVLVPVEAMLLTLAKMGALPAFVDLVLDYLPLHLHLAKYHVLMRGTDHWRYMLWEFLHFGRRPINLWIPAALCGFLLAKRVTAAQPRQRALLYLLAALAILYAVYPAFSGQFWWYHYLPFLYFIIVMASTLFIPARGFLHSWWRWYPLAMILATEALIMTTLYTALIPAPEKMGMYLGYAWPAPKMGLVDRMAGELARRMKPGDTVQPLDWAGGGIQALLIDKVRLPTTFMYNYHFYHDIDNPVIQRFRHEFMLELERTRPRFILDVKTAEHVSGEDTTTEFAALTDYIAQHYKVDVSDKDFTLYERR